MSDHLSSSYGEDKSVLLFDGTASETDQALILSLVGRLGYTATFASSDSSEAVAESISPNPSCRVSEEQKGNQSGGPTYRFSDLANPSHILVREHVEDLATHLNEPTTNFVRSFHTLIDSGNQSRLFRLTSNYQRGATRTYEQIREPQPLPGVTVVQRDDVGIEPYDRSAHPVAGKDAQIMLRYGIVVGSMISSANPNLLHMALQRKHIGQATLRALRILVTRLDRQLA